MVDVNRFGTILATAGLMAAGCADPPGVCPKDHASAEGDTVEDGGPRILDHFLPEADRVTPDQVVLVDVEVCHPDGLSAVREGEIRSADGETVLQPLKATDFTAIYRGVVRWVDLNDVETIQFVGPVATREVVLAMPDADGREASRRIEIRLSCPDGGACEGACAPLLSDAENCGACGTQCTALDQPIDAPICTEGTCVPAYSACVELGDEAMTCDDVCASDRAEACVADGCPEGTAWLFEAETACEGFEGSGVPEAACDDAFTATDGAFVRCCCSDFP